MKIAFVDHPWSKAVPPVQSGSISIWTWEVARRVARQHETLVYEGGGDFLRSHLHHCEGVEYRMQWIGADNIAARMRERFWPDRDVTRPYAALGLYYLGYAMKVAADIRKERCDVAHVHQFSQIVPVLRKFNPDIKIVLHMNCEWLTQFDRKLIEPRLKQSDLILGCSDHITNLVRRQFPEEASRCRTVYNGVDVEKFVPLQDDSRLRNRRIKKLLFVGRVSPEKGLHDLLDAFSLVVRRWPDVELEIIGPEYAVPFEWLVGLSDDPAVIRLKEFYDGNSYRSHLDKRIPPAIAEKVRFTGGISNSELTSRYHDADILINPSLSESFGMTVAEAMASGKPVIVTRVGGMTETVVQGKNGLSVPGSDPAALADAIVSLLADDELCRSMGRAGRGRAVDLYSWDQVAASLLNSYGVAVDGKAARVLAGR